MSPPITSCRHGVLALAREMPAGNLLNFIRSCTWEGRTLHRDVGWGLSNPLKKCDLPLLPGAFPEGSQHRTLPPVSSTWCFLTLGLSHLQSHPTALSRCTSHGTSAGCSIPGSQPFPTVLTQGKDAVFRKQRCAPWATDHQW